MRSLRHLSTYNSPELDIASRHSETPQTLNSSVTVMQNPATGKQVHLVGAIHIGSPQYYANTQEYLDNVSDSGGRVHYELIDSPRPDPSRPLNGGHILDLMCLGFQQGGTKHLFNRFSRDYGLVRQIDHIDYRPNWRNRDIDALSFARSIGRIPLLVTGLQRRIGGLLMRLQPARSNRALKKALLELNDNPEMPAPKGLFKKHKQRVNQTVIDKRNLIAFDSAREDLDAGVNKLALYWGEGHVPGLRKLFSDIGYQAVRTSFVEAADLSHTTYERAPSPFRFPEPVPLAA